MTILGQSIISVHQDSYLQLNEGWNMFGYSCYDKIDASSAFTTIEDKIIIAKNSKHRAPA